MSEAVHELVQAAITRGDFPGACYAFGKLGGDLVIRCAGRYTYCPESPEIRTDSIWDLASVSKVVGTTTAAMLLFDEGKLLLEQPVAEVLPEFTGEAKERITVRNLLVHDSGLIAFRPFHQTLKRAEEVWPAICSEKLTYATGSKMVYSDLNMITLQKVIETLSGKPLQELLSERVWTPLGMKDTLYCPGVANERCVPTEGVEPWRAELRRLRKVQPVTDRKQYPDCELWIQGEVHDPAATVLGGVAGHAGLFSTAPDLVRFCKFMLAAGEELIKPETVRLFTRKQSDLSSRGLGWDTKSPSGSSAGSKFGSRSFGHTGYTGTSVWIDPEARAYAVLLTNRVHPSAANTKIIQFRPVFHDAVFSALA